MLGLAEDNVVRQRGLFFLALAVRREIKRNGKRFLRSTR